MIVDDSIIEDFLNCKYKAYLHALKGPARDTEYGFVERIEREKYRQRFVDHVKAAGLRLHNDGSALHPKSDPDPHCKLFLQLSVEGDGYHINLDALMPDRSTQRNGLQWWQ